MGPDRTGTVAVYAQEGLADLLRRRAASWPRCALLATRIYLGYDVVKGRVSPCRMGSSRNIVNRAINTHGLVGPKAGIGDGRSEGGDRAQWRADDGAWIKTYLHGALTQAHRPQAIPPVQGQHACNRTLEEIADLVQRRSSKMDRDGIDIGVGTVVTTAVAHTAPDPKIVEAGRARCTHASSTRRMIEVHARCTALEAAVVIHVEVERGQREPNDDVLHAEHHQPGKLVTAAIGAPADFDFYTFTTPEKYQMIRIEVQTSRRRSARPSSCSMRRRRASGRCATRPPAATWSTSSSRPPRPSSRCARPTTTGRAPGPLPDPRHHGQGLRCPRAERRHSERHSDQRRDSG